MSSTRSTDPAARGAGRGRVCFYSELAYPLIARRRIEFAGGAESQVVQLARGLAGRGYEVSLVTCDFGQPAREVLDGIEVLRSFRPQAGIPKLRFLHPRLTLASAALARADADAYYVCGSGTSAGLTAEVARLRGAGFVLAIMTDHDVARRPPPDSDSSHRWWYFRALRRADRVLAQTEYQRARLRSELGRESTILPNLVHLAEPVDPGRGEIVLWLATYKPAKRPEWFLALARDLPHLRFVMAGVVPPPPLTAESFEAARAAARELPNLEVRGFLDAAEQDALRRRAALLVHTSPLEGFSNVLLEAWAAGLPTVSGVDPDGLVTREGLGVHASDYPALVRAVSALMADPEARRAAGARARRYAEGRHAPDAVLDTLAAALDPLIAAARARRGR